MRNQDIPRLGLIERVVAGFAPKWGVRRLLARGALSNLQRSYDGAGRGRGFGSWRTGGGSANAEIERAGALLRARMRDLVRNNPAAANAIQVLVSSLVGSGIRPRSATGNATLDAKVDALFARFAEAADFHGHTDFYGLQALALREVLEGGEVLALRRFERRGSKGRVPLQIELKEADHLDDSKIDTGASGRVIRQGIEYGTDGRRLAYWLFPDHPGDTMMLQGRPNIQSVRVPVERCAHMFERQRMQARGVPWGAPVITALRQFDDWHDAEMERKKTEACLVGVVIGGDADGQSLAPLIKDAEGNTVEEFRPGMLAYARDGQDVKFTQPASTGGVYEWSRVQWHVIAQGFRIPYALLTTDLSQTNFSSSRVGLNEFRRMVDALQWHMIIPMFCQPIWGWFIEAALLNGDLPAETEFPVEWDPPGFESVNPLQDAQADAVEVRSGFASLPQKIARRGYNPTAVINEQAEFLKSSDALGLVLDTDPRKVARSGQSQTTPPDAGAGQS